MIDPTKPGALGVFVHHAALALGRLHEIQETGFDYIAVKVADGRTAFNADTLPRLLCDGASIGLPVVAWGYFYPSNSLAGSPAQIAKLLPAGITHLILDCEAEWESPGAAVNAGAFCQGLKLATGNKVALHLSSFYATAEHSVFPYQAFLSHCASFMPQSYVEGATSAATVMQRTRLQAAPLAKAYGAAMVPTVNTPALLGLLGAIGATRANVWLWDGDGQDAGVCGHEEAWKAAIGAFKGGKIRAGA